MRPCAGTLLFKEETIMNVFKEAFSGVHGVTKKAVAFALAGILILSCGFISGSVSKICATLNSDELVNRLSGSSAQSQQSTPVDPAPTEAPTEAPVTPQQPSDTPTEAPTQGSDTPAPSGEKTTDEIIALFNESANKIKTSASSVTRNYEDLQHNEEYLEMPGLLKSLGSGLISQFLKKDETPLVYGSQADIIANYPVKTKDFVSKATAGDIAEATCADDGTYYNITLKFKECTDPSGTGTDSAFNIIQSEEVVNAVPIKLTFSVKYYDGTIVCKIEKATGNMVSANYTLPMIMSVKAMGVNAQIGMTFIDDYSIAY